MKIDQGFTSISFETLEKSLYPRKKVFDWQIFAYEICTLFHTPSKERPLIYKICKTYPRSFVQHCLDETKELALGNQTHYFTKIIFKYAPRTQTSCGKDSN